MAAVAEVLSPSRSVTVAVRVTRLSVARLTGSSGLAALGWTTARSWSSVTLPRASTETVNTSRSPGAVHGRRPWPPSRTSIHRLAGGGIDEAGRTGSDAERIGDRAVRGTVGTERGGEHAGEARRGIGDKVVSSTVSTGWVVEAVTTGVSSSTSMASEPVALPPSTSVTV